MHYWTNTAQAPSRLDERSDQALQYVMKQLDVADCDLKMLRAGIESDTQMPVHLTPDSAVAGLWEFHPVMDMSYNKNGVDYAETTVLSKGLTAKGKYVPVKCEDGIAHLAYWPKCGNVSAMVKKEDKVVEKEKVIVKKEYNTIVERETDIIIRPDECHQVPTPETVSLMLLGLVLIVWVIKRTRK